MDSDNDESQCEGVAVENEEYHEEVLLEPDLQLQSVCTVCLVLRLHSTEMQSLPPRKRVCSEWAKSPDKRMPDLQWALPSCLQNSVIQTLTGGRRGKKDNEASHINHGSTPGSVFVLYFAGLSHCIWWR
jgi:hypothetical protein